MKWEEWKPFYERIVKEMGYSIEEDRRAAELLRDILMENDNYIIKEELNSIIMQKVYVFGAGPNLEEALKKGDFKDGTKIAADGATSALLEYGITPDVVVTDLDGRIRDLLEASRKAVMVVHAHGDNMDKLPLVVEFPLVLGTCQTEPLDIVYNFGGFTDGDRAAFLAEEMGAKEIVLVGFDFSGIVGKWSKPWLRDHTPAWESKMKKLKFARELLEWLKNNGRAKIIEFSI
ncbi:6-hydroxymethyl-7,8-dihydropterin pyrophosphokinase [Pyrococcus furiosus DSM 3638]|uniref:6-hydroxymethyl-7,8-dihydropterin pyrophosphokinase n=3 Tax=Pyrococcus furiosus TaxID=2261 RepID=MPTE_PYRFU|nr:MULTISPECIES: 6-hydroxymethyl-7,8-dihydropterin pyrophosphokinase [Pyrococcus]Q8U2A9.1 RecName: Full=6-hydroxymethyl-7,8-dihydropterin pyrophosphokinase; Short=HPPK; AltName: Full=2-amino-4-hydroxy-6-hydroxymethyldihydropteridine pyrophosphokinase; AltName: Full=6-hydroxymethyl-7,8-dihydropterin diphosphokinase; Short=6-HMPDK; AltName: Full=7,8-dihydro-6-hydroxymethylpterin diphosphokinase; AltName: Full=7,8-dihydro-6-hydroxymethylpterin pyrophosphokinase; Short=PPPK [Pyrococcus furiosus DSM 36